MPNLKRKSSSSPTAGYVKPRADRAPSLAEVEARLRDPNGALARLPLEAMARLFQEIQDEPEISGEPTHTLRAAAERDGQG